MQQPPRHSYALRSRRSPPRTCATTAATKKKKRSRTADDECTRLRSIVERLCEAYTCPITHELPIDAVVACDGHVYERVAILEHLRRKPTSPLTNLEMPPRLVPAVCVKNTIAEMVRANAVPDDLIHEWKRKLCLNHIVDRLGNAPEHVAEHCFTLAATYMNGVTFRICGARHTEIPRDARRGFECYRRAAELGHDNARAYVALCYLCGHGVEASETMGMLRMHEAADSGSEMACYILGVLWATGCCGACVDRPRAHARLTQMQHCMSKTCVSKHLREDARRFLASDDDADDGGEGIGCSPMRASVVVLLPHDLKSGDRFCMERNGVNFELDLRDDYSLYLNPSLTALAPPASCNVMNCTAVVDRGAHVRSAWNFDEWDYFSRPLVHGSEICRAPRAHTN